MSTITKDNVVFYSEDSINSELITQSLIAFDDLCNDRLSKVEVGRGKVARLSLDNINYILRLYRRGGFVSKFNSKLFLKTFGKNRPCHEYQLTLKLYKSGVKVPYPVLCLTKSRLLFFYYAAILFKELKESENLLNLMSSATVNIADIITACYLAGKEARSALNIGVFHADLHPGNILLHANSCFLIDFDKAIEFDPTEKSILSYALKISKRWERSVLKRVKDSKLNSQIIETFNKGLFDSHKVK